MMTHDHSTDPRKLRVYTAKDIQEIFRTFHRQPEDWAAMTAVASVLPFRVNNYVLEELIDWDNIPEDPIFQLTFPQKGMLGPEDLERMTRLVKQDASSEEIRGAANEIRWKLNPHPALQMELNVPSLDGRPLPGMQHKYRETVLFFPSQGQTCHSYCTYCFRWPQFVGIKELKFSAHETQMFHQYLRLHREVTDVLFTGGDPMVMKAHHLAAYIEPLLSSAFEHIQNFRIGTKSVAYWPYRFVTDTDAEDLLRLFEKAVQAGRHVAVMAHYSHPRELSTPIARECVRRIRATGSEIRCQAPLVRHVNDSPEAWAELWTQQVNLGCIPYYMFVERDTGPKNYFEVPLAEAYRIFCEAYRRVSGLARTVRGPTMSATPGKVQILGTADVNGEKIFVLTFLQAWNPSWVRQPFFARFDPRATWFTHLKPAFGQPCFFFEPELEDFRRRRQRSAPCFQPTALVPDSSASVTTGFPGIPWTNPIVSH